MQIEPKLLTPVESGLIISRAAALLGVSKDTLRRWEKSGLISPKRTSGGIRRYSFEDLKMARFNSGRRLYRMKQLFSHNKPVVKTILFTSLFWLLVILALKITSTQQTTVLPPVLTDTPKSDLKYSDKSDQYFSLHPIPQNQNPTVIKRN